MVEIPGLDAAQWEFWDSWTRAQRLLVRELERGLQQTCGISKPEFSVLVVLWRTPGRQMRVGELSEALDWDKSRVSHQLTRMEKRGFVERSRYGADGRRAGIGLTPEGRDAARRAIDVHGANIRRHFFDALTPEQADVIGAWSRGVLTGTAPERGEPEGGGPGSDGGGAGTDRGEVESGQRGPGSDGNAQGAGRGGSGTDRGSSGANRSGS
jgi:DNA-binding MarR family transcriptional regulator